MPVIIEVVVKLLQRSAGKGLAAMRQRFVTRSALCFLAVCVMGCSQLPDVGSVFTRAPDPQLVAVYAPKVYPADAPVGDDLYIVVRREGRNLVADNFTDRRFENMTCWINQQWVGTLDIMAIGPGNRYDLLNFINEHGEPFPTGTFLSPDKAQALALVELFDEEAGLRHRLVVRVERRGFF
jgi:hypothetical protein